MHDLTAATVTVLRIQRFLAVQLVRDLPTLTLAVPLDRAELVGGLDHVGRTVLPLLVVNSVLWEEICIGWFGQRRGRRWDLVHGEEDGEDIYVSMYRLMSP